ncbi:hypothetical protein UlMin_005165 [Ulmus minor]
MLWNSRVLPRHKLLWWLALLGELPTKDRLARIFQIDNPVCPFCNTVDESLVHLLSLCPFTLHLWMASPWHLNPSILPASSITDWCYTLWSIDDAIQSNGAVIRFTACLMDMVLRIRNEVVHGAVVPSISTTFKRIIYSFNYLHDSFSLRSTPSILEWKAPHPDWIKVNFDAFVFDIGSIVVAVARDSSGVVVGWDATALSTMLLVEAEARACLLAVKLAVTKGWRCCEFEGDAKVVVEACSRDIGDIPWQVELMVKDIGALHS